MNRTSAYQALPQPLQEVVVNLEAARIRATRYGGDFDERLQAAIERYERGPTALLETQEERLEEALTHFSRYVPKFRHLSAATVTHDPHGVLAALETTDKTSIRSSPEAYIATAAAGSVEEHRTSGTTGTALHFLSTRKAVREQWAVWWRFRSWFGLQPGSWHGIFGGKPVVPGRAQRRYWRVAYPLRQVFYSSLHISLKSAKSYLDDIERRGLTWLHGYPSAIASLARLALASELPAPPALQTITGGAEGLSVLDASVLDRWFSGRVLEHYGLAEGVANLSACSVGRLHVDEDFAVVEFHETEAVGHHEVVGTNITNLAQAFVRYRTGDLVADLTNGCRCGWSGRSVARVDGRLDDVIVTADGHLVGRLGQLFYDANSVAKAQIVQREPGVIEIHLVPVDVTVESADLDAIAATAALRLGSKTEIRFHIAPTVPFPSATKHRLVRRLFDLSR